jgi:hypothetical protein
MSITPENMGKLKKLKQNLPFCAKSIYKIVSKEGKLISLSFNKAQAYAHQQIEDQKMRTGMVRKIILKGRQQGISTYIGARNYHKTSMNNGKRTFIMAHDKESTTKLFNMVQDYHDNLPDSLRQPTKASNAKEIIFSENHSRYYVGTAGSGDVGRGGTVQLFHGSEVAFWKNTDKILTGVLQSVPRMKDSEIILESTANGMANMFYNKCMDAMKGIGDFELIFIPWFWQEEYEITPPDDYELDDQEEELYNTYLKDLYGYENAKSKLYWRRLKITELGGEWKFKQEYPFNVMEAFQTSGDSLISNEDIVRARECTTKDRHAPLVMGVDPARDGDRTVIAFRRGRECPVYYTYNNMDEMRLAGIVSKHIEKYKPVKCFIDVGLGYGTIDRLRERGFKKIVEGVHFGSGAMEDNLYMNKRVEMWFNLRDWLEQQGINIPDDNELHVDLSCIPRGIETSSGKWRLVPKDKIREISGISPDIGDALALTFAFPVHMNDNEQTFSKKNSSETSYAGNKLRNKAKSTQDSGTGVSTGNFDFGV